MLARLYVANEQYNDAIPVLAEIVKQEPGWLDGASLLVQAYVAAGRGDDAVRWLEDAVQISPQLYPTLADMYARARRYADASAAYESALKISLRSVDLRIRYAGMLLGTGVEKDAVRARDVLREAVEMRRTRRPNARTCAPAAGAGRAAHRRARRIGADGAPRHFAEPTQPARVRRARRDFRGTSQVSGRCRRARAGRRTVPERRGSRGRPLDAAAAPWLRVSAARPVRQGDRHAPGSSQDHRRRYRRSRST